MTRKFTWRFRWRFLDGEWEFDSRTYFSRAAALAAAIAFEEAGDRPIITELMQR